VSCPACTAPSDSRDRAISHEQVAVRTQYASPNLIAAIAYERERGARMVAALFIEGFRFAKRSEAPA